MALDRRVMAATATVFFLSESAPARGETAMSFALSTGQYGMRKEVPHALALDVQLRAPWRWGVLHPMGGLLATTTGSAFVYSGVAIELELSRHLLLTPGFAPGVVLAGADDLGSPLEFRSSLELLIAPTERLRVGISFSHLSNGGLGDRNPGVETLMLGVAFRPGG